jgi:MFS family permease
LNLIRGLGEFIRRQNHNYRMMLIRSGGATFLFNLTSNYTNIYTKALGASSVTLGALSSLSSVINMFISLPTGWLTDIYGLKRIMGMGMASQILMVGLYAMARDWRWIMVAMAISPFNMALLMRSQNILISNSLESHDRATGFGLRSLLSQILGLLSPIPAALLVERFGGLTVEGIRPLYYIRFLGLALLYYYIYSRIDHVPPHPRSFEGGLMEDFRVVMRGGVGLRSWIFVECLGALVWGTIEPFTFVYAAEVKGADPITLGFMTTTSIILSIILAVPINRLADTRGRKFSFLITRPALWVWFTILVLAPHQNWLILAWFFRGIGFSSSAYQTLSMELVHEDHRGRWLGITNTFSSLVRIPAPIIGGLIYSNINPSLVFISSLIIDMVFRSPLIALGIPETLRPDDFEEGIGN